MKLFADDVKLYCSFDNFTYDLQIVCDKLTEWADKWQMKIAFNKCTVHIELVTVTAILIKILDIGLLLEVRYWANHLKHVILELLLTIS